MRINLLRAHGSPTRYQYRLGCRCVACRGGVATRNRRYHETHRKEIAETKRIYGKSHLGAKRNAEYQSLWRAANPEYVNLWYKGHKEDRSESRRRCRENHPREIAAQGRAHKAIRRARLHGNSGTHTAADIRAQYERQRGRCYWCKKKVGDDYHTDHVVPLALGGSNGKENIVVTCPTCNLEKHAQHPMDFAGVLL